MTRNSNLISAIDSASTKTYEKTYYMPQSEIWQKSFVLRSVWVTWGHLKVIWRSFGERNQLSIQNKLWKDILRAPKWDMVRKLCFQVTWGHLKVIWRSFVGSKLKSDNQLTQHPKKPIQRRITCQKMGFSEKVMFSGYCRSLQDIWRSDEVIWWPGHLK